MVTSNIGRAILFLVVGVLTSSAKFDAYAQTTGGSGSFEFTEAFVPGVFEITSNRKATVHFMGGEKQYSATSVSTLTVESTGRKRMRITLSPKSFKVKENGLTKFGFEYDPDKGKLTDNGKIPIRGLEKYSSLGEVVLEVVDGNRLHVTESLRSIVQNAARLGMMSEAQAQSIMSKARKRGLPETIEFPGIFPPGNWSVGDKWSEPAAEKTTGVHSGVSATYTVIDVKEIQGSKLVEVDVQQQLRPDTAFGNLASIAKFAPVSKTPIALRSGGFKGRIYYDLAERRITETVGTQTLEFVLSRPGSTRQTPLSVVENFSVRTERIGE